MNWFRKLVGRGETRSDQAAIDPGLLELIDKYGLAAFDRQLVLAEMAGDLDWTLDQDAGLLHLSDDLVLPAQIIGTTSAATGTWRWAWANPSIPDPMAKRAREAAHIGRERGIAVLTEPDVALTAIGDGHVLALAVAGLLDSDASYRCPHDAGEVFVLLEAPRVRQSPDEPAARAVHVISRALLGLPLTRAAVANYLVSLGLPVTESGREVRIGSGEAGTIRFDRHGRATEVSGMPGVTQPTTAVPSAAPVPTGIPLSAWRDEDLESRPGWRDSRGLSPVDVLRRYQKARHDWEKEATRAGDRRWPEMKQRLSALYAEVATPRPIEERATSFGNPPSRDPDRTRIVAVSKFTPKAATLRLEEDDPSGQLIDDIEIQAVLLDGEWRLKDRVAVFGDERITGLL